eukprot:3423485-Rhodomonas_salina.1
MPVLGRDGSERASLSHVCEGKCGPKKPKYPVPAYSCPACPATVCMLVALVASPGTTLRTSPVPGYWDVLAVRNSNTN